MKCKTCKASCIWRGGSDKPEDMKCLVGYKPITNGDQIRKMTDEELAKHLYWWDNSPLHASLERWLDWLKQEAKGED